MRKTVVAIIFLFAIPAVCSAYWDDEWEARTETDAYSNDALNSALAGEASCVKIAALSFIRIYQLTFSGNTGSKCAFYPSCSRYAFFSIKKYGAIKGFLMSAERLIRCNPGAEGYEIDAERELFYDPPEAGSIGDNIFNWINF